jgi:inward rectifier potassium channel
MATSSRPPPPSAPLPKTPRATAPGIVKIGLKTGTFDDIYHFMMEASWKRLLVLIAAMYLGTNAVFAGLYVLAGDSINGAQEGSFADAFFFSVQTLSTVGYGVMAPKGFIGSTLVTFEAFIGLLGMAMASGLMFSKFARPTARVIFSSKVIITTRDGRPCLALRMANGRANEIVEATLRISVLKPEVTSEGEKLRRFHDLALVRSQTPLFTLTWLVIHMIDEQSPLFGETDASLHAMNVRFVVTLTGIDSTFAQTVHARTSYFADDVVWGGRFVDVTSQLLDGRLQVDYTKFNDVVVEPRSSVEAVKSRAAA